MIVLDASAVIELLLATATGEAVARRIGDPDETLHAPHLLDLEVAQVLRRFVSASILGAPRARSALIDLGDLDLTRYPHDVLLPRVWQLRANLTAYDASYVVLAETLGAVLVTCDARLARAPGHAATVEVL